MIKYLANELGRETERRGLAVEKNEITVAQCSEVLRFGSTKMNSAYNREYIIDERVDFDGKEKRVRVSKNVFSPIGSKYYGPLNLSESAASYSSTQTFG